MQTINMKSLQKLIAANNGTLSTAVIAEVLGKQHGHLVAKLETQLGKSLLSNFETNEKYTKNAQGAQGTRTVYLLPERESMALSMSYDMNIAMEVWDAFKAYEAALIAVTLAGTLEEAQAVANKALDVHTHMIIKKPLARIRLFLNEFTDINEGVTVYIKLMKGNTKSLYEDRIRTLASLTNAINESYDNLSARNITAVIQHEDALKLIAREERYQARVKATRLSTKVTKSKVINQHYDF